MRWAGEVVFFLQAPDKIGRVMFTTELDKVPVRPIMVKVYLMCDIALFLVRFLGAKAEQVCGNTNYYDRRIAENI